METYCNEKTNELQQLQVSINQYKNSSNSCQNDKVAFVFPLGCSVPNNYEQILKCLYVHHNYCQDNCCPYKRDCAYLQTLANINLGVSNLQMSYISRKFHFIISGTKTIHISVIERRKPKNGESILIIQKNCQIKQAIVIKYLIAIQCQSGVNYIQYDKESTFFYRKFWEQRNLQNCKRYFCCKQPIPRTTYNSCKIIKSLSTNKLILIAPCAILSSRKNNGGKHGNDKAENMGNNG